MKIVMTGFAAFWHVCGHDKAIAQQVVALLEIDIAQHIADIEQAFINKDSDTLREVFHKLNGNLSHLGFTRRAKAFKYLEEMAGQQCQTAILNKYHKEKSFVVNLAKVLAEEVDNH